MSYVFNVPLEEVVKTRTSVRTYNGIAVSQDIKDQINQYINNLSGPFSPKVTFKLLESKSVSNSAKLGTYGVIKGAFDYIGATVNEEELCLEELGYEFEKLILYITSLGLGTCWLGGTFKKSEFASAMGVKEKEIFPAISPLGYSADKKSLTDSFVRLVAKSAHRKAWEELFFNNNFSTPLNKTDCGEYADSLEMIRLAPSASNKQPWRIVKDDNSYHFYEIKAQGYDIQRVDMGIAICHFHLASVEKNLKGEFKKLSPTISGTPDNGQYIVSWVCE